MTLTAYLAMLGPNFPFEKRDIVLFPPSLPLACFTPIKPRLERKLVLSSL